MSRWRHEPTAHATWHRGALHVWGWDGTEVADLAWLYRGFGPGWGPDGRGPVWEFSPAAFGELSRVWITLDPDRPRWAPCVRLHPAAVVTWLQPPPDELELSDSLRWMIRATELAQQLMVAQRVVPVIHTVPEAHPTSGAVVAPGHESEPAVARWVAVPDAPCRELIHRLDEAMPAVLHAAGEPPVAQPAPAPDRAHSGPTTAAEIIDQMVDDLVREQLYARRWKPDLGRSREVRLAAARATFTALAGRNPVITGRRAELRPAIDELQQRLQRHHRRLIGVRVLAPRLRLIPPFEPSEPWEVMLELVDTDDAGRWCTAAEVWARHPAALAVVGADGDGDGDGHGDEAAGALEAAGAQLLAAAAACAAAIDQLSAWARTDHPTDVLVDLDDVDDFLDRAPAELTAMGIDLVGPELLVAASARVRGQATSAPTDDRRSRFSAEALIDWSVSVDRNALSQTELDRLIASGSTLLHTGHRWVRIDPDQLKRARAAAMRQHQRHARVSALKLLQLLQDEHLDLGIASATADSSLTALDSTLLAPDWIGTLFGGLDDEQLAEADEPEGFVGALRPYQRRGLGWLQFLARAGLGGCLADDMGLGKTATTLAHLLTQPGPHLVICPLSVVHNWEAEAQRFTPSLRVLVHHGADRELGTEPDADLVITTYGLAQRDPDLHGVAWGTVVLDEAQMVKNPNTKAARAVRRLMARQKVALTGTPVENRLVELWSILDAVVPGVLGSQQRFRERYAMPIERHGDQEVAERLRTVTAPFVLRRTKADRRLLPDLPDKIEQIAYAELTPEQSVLYQQVAQQLLHDAEQLTGMQRRGRVLAALTRLKQICNHPAHALADGSRLNGRSGKLARFDELLVDLLDVGERALVFTQFREMGTLLHRHLDQHHGISADFLHGGVARTRRQAMIERFNASDGPPVLLVSLKAGGTGLNLVAASQVIHYDRWWNPAVEDQATDRAWRLGQRRTVNVHKLVSRGTIEERIGQVIDEKRRLAETVVGTSENWLADLSTDDLRELVVLEHQRPGVADRHRPRAAEGAS